MSPSRRLLLQCVALLVAVVAVALVVARVTSSEARTTVAVDQSRPGPVLLVPGYGGSTAALSVLADRLRADGREATVLALPGDGRGDLRETAEVVRDAADAAMAAGAPSVDVVGYSAGGITVRYWVRELGGASLARRVVTLGSPHHGTEVAGLGAAFAPGSCPEACRQLVPGSDLLDALNDGDETPPGPQWLTVWTEGDELVRPAESARLEGAQQVVLQQVCPGLVVGHGQLPTAPLVIGLVRDALGAGPVSAPAPCTDLQARGR